MYGTHIYKMVKCIYKSGEITLTVHDMMMCLWMFAYGLEFDPDKWILTSFALVMLCV